jgi:hypothetical protein
LKNHLRFLMSVVAVLLVAGGSLAYGLIFYSSIMTFQSPIGAYAPQPGAVLGNKVSRHVVFVLVDALRLDTALNEGVMPTFNELRTKGAFAAMRSRTPSFSMPGYSTFFTGAWPDLNGAPPMNADFADTPTWKQDNIFSATTRAGLKTVVSGYYWFEKLIPQDAVSLSFYTPGDDRAADVNVMNAALPWLQEGMYDFALIHLDQVDYAGHHEGGPRDPRWNEAAQRVDDYLSQVAGELDFTKDTLVVCSDHGQIAAGGHGGAEEVVTTEPFLLVGAGVNPGDYGNIQMVDVAPTLAALLGTNIPAASQGRVLAEMLELPMNTLDQLPAKEQSQQEALLVAYGKAIDQSVIHPSLSDVSAYQASLDSMHLARLNHERLIRFLIVLSIMLVPIILMIIKRKWKVGWMVLGVLLYFAVFNLIYLLVIGKSYSFSSVEGPIQLMTHTAISAIIAFIAGWVWVVWKYRVFDLESGEGSKQVLRFTWLAIYGLMFPLALCLILNGYFITWTLPEITTSFVGILSALQILFVAIAGLLLVVITPLLVGWRKRLQH